MYDSNLYMQESEVISISPRTGRPPKGKTSRDSRMTIALTGEEMKGLNECAERLKKTRTDTICRRYSTG